MVNEPGRASREEELVEEIRKLEDFDVAIAKAFRLLFYEDEDDRVDGYLLLNDSKEPIAFLLLHTCYKEGYGVGEDEKKAFDFCLRAAQAGISYAQDYVGRIYTEPLDNEMEEKPFVHHTEKVAWLKKASDQGVGTASYELSELYSDGEPDEPKTLLFLTRAAEQGHASAQLQLGISMYLHSRLKKKAVSWIEKSALQGDSSAQRYLGHVYCKSNPEKAFLWYTQSASQKDHRSLFELAYFHDQGIHVRKNTEKALKLYEEADFLGDKRPWEHGWWILHCRAEKSTNLDSLPLYLPGEAQFRIGRMYEIGAQPAVKNLTTAAEWYEKASLSGYDHRKKRSRSPSPEEKNAKRHRAN